MTYYEKENLREDITILKYLEQWLLEKGIPREERLHKLEKHKKRIRQKMKDIYKRDEESEIIFHAAEDGTGWIEKEWYSEPFTDEEKEEYIDMRWQRIHCPWDCTGLAFTRWIEIFNVDTSFGKCAVVYHAKGLDV